MGDLIILTNVGSPHALGQKPIAFPCKVVALCQAPFLMDDPNVGVLFPADAIARAKHYLSMTSGGLELFDLYRPEISLLLCRLEFQMQWSIYLMDLGICRWCCSNFSHGREKVHILMDHTDSRLLTRYFSPAVWLVGWEQCIILLDLLNFIKIRALIDTPALDWQSQNPKVVEDWSWYGWEKWWAWFWCMTIKLRF
ncbi:hypothetical protein ACET3Z_016873 [Daucus carota]